MFDSKHGLYSGMGTCRQCGERFHWIQRPDGSFLLVTDADEPHWKSCSRAIALETQAKRYPVGNLDTPGKGRCWHCGVPVMIRRRDRAPQRHLTKGGGMCPGAEKRWPESPTHKPAYDSDPYLAGWVQRALTDKPA